MTTNTEAPALGERLRRYSRYVAIVAEQLDALERGDHDQLLELMKERRELETACGVSAEELNAEMPSPVLEEALRIGLSELEEKCGNERRTREQWIEISAGALRSARSLSLRPPPPAGRYPEMAARGERLDLRL